MQHRFRFLGACQGETWQLEGDEAQHLTKVLRLAVGTAVEVTDGRGLWALATVAAVHGREVFLQAEPARQDPPPRLLLEFAIGALKPGAVDDLLPALTELGIDRFHVFHQQDSAKARMTPKVLERWQRILVQSVKQCKRSRLPELHQYESLAAFCEGFNAAAPEVVTKVMLRGAGDPPLPRLLASAAEGRIVLLAGGEKGLTASEEEVLLAASFQPASLGPFVLRAVTAAVAAAATMSLHRAELC